MSNENSLAVITIPAFKDNYFWLIHDSQYAVVVDPGDALPVLAALNHYNLQLVAILITHHHADHIGGTQDLLDICKVPVFGPQNPAIKEITHRVKHHDRIDIPLLGLELLALEVPGHTLDHLAFVAMTHGWLFCGDTLFACGCGRVFEGTHEQMFTSLSLLATMQDNTIIFCAHEYTLANQRFAQTVEPENLVLAARQKADSEKRAENIPTVPTNLALEKQTNPFLRCSEPSVIQTLVQQGKLGDDHSPLAVFTALREWKNVFQ